VGYRLVPRKAQRARNVLGGADHHVRVLMNHVPGDDGDRSCLTKM
jgi:hypothetical protein